MLTRLATVTAAVALALALAATSARADGAVDPVNCEARRTAPECVVEVISVEEPHTGGSSGIARCRDMVGNVAPCFIQRWGWNSDDGCYYKRASQEWSETFPVQPPAVWYEGTCIDTRNGAIVMVRMRLFGSPPGRALLVAEAVKRLRLPPPVIGLNPAPPAAQVVHLPTWLWVDRSAWGVRRATASVPGLSVTATATPVSVRWTTGDGGRVTCRGAGTPWREDTDPSRASPDCGHTYAVSSGEGMFTVSATITWRVSWVGGGRSGIEPAMTSTASAELTVVGLPTVITGAGG